MKLYRTWLMGFLFIAVASGWSPAGQEAPLTAAEKSLADQINKVRLDNGKPPIEVTQSLTKVARLHIGDLNTNHPATGEDNRGEECNLHSWSNQGAWQPVCYTDDHAYSNLMWSKPSELTSYTGSGYEIASFYGAGMTPEQAMASWRDSSEHLDVILEQGVFTGHPMKAMGVGISGSYACVWFGEIADPAGPIPAAAQPTTAQDYPDVRAYAGGLALSILDTTIAGNEPLKLVLGLNGRNSADLTGCRYSVQQKTTAGGWKFIFHSQKGFFRNLSMAPGDKKNWSWDRRIDEGQAAPGPGKYRVKFKAPRYTSDIIYREFEILR